MPYTSGIVAGPDVANIVLRDQCAIDLADHRRLSGVPAWLASAGETWWG